jgi:hypothetical protein
LQYIAIYYTTVMVSEINPNCNEFDWKFNFIVGYMLVSGTRYKSNKTRVHWTLRIAAWLKRNNNFLITKQRHYKSDWQTMICTRMFDVCNKYFC